MFSFLNKKNSLLVVLFFLFGHGAVWADENTDLSPATEKWLQKFKKVEYELSGFGNTASELLLNCSYLQDVCLAYLHDAETPEEYEKGMQLFQDNTRRFRSVCRYVTSVFNFYTAEREPPSPQMVETTFQGQENWGFLNTFKLRRELTAEEREKFFFQEASRFLEDGLVQPFILDASTINDLQVNTIYNFVLFPDGTIVAALERLGDREYQVRDEVVMEAFTYPNHTILAGDPQQIVVSAGAFIIHQVADKRLFFISCKSGHFQPTYASLEEMRIQLGELGVNPSTVLPVPDIDLSRAVIKTYNRAKVPVLLTQEDTTRLFQIALARWENSYREIDREMLSGLAQGDISFIDEELKATLKKQRAESTYMRSAYHLFSAEHESPGSFGELVKRFGKLKDAIKHYGRAKFKLERVQREATVVLDLIDRYESEKAMFGFTPADDISFYTVLSGNISEIQDLLSRQNVTLDEYHQLKKLSRETGALFMYMAHDAKWKGRGYSVYHTTSDGFFQINDLMAQAEYIYDEEDCDQETRVIVPRKIVNHINKYIEHLGIAPPSFSIQIDPKEAYWMINSAKDLYFSSKVARETFWNIEDYRWQERKGDINEQNIDYSEILLLLKDLKRDIEIARNAWIFLDVSHTALPISHEFTNRTDQMIAAVERRDYEWIKKEAHSYGDLCSKAPSLEKWQCTDQDSFNATLEENLSGLHALKNEAVLSSSQAEEITAAAQAFRDLVHLIRRNGVSETENPLPIVCFDALEEHADALLEGLEDTLKHCTKKIEVTPEIERHAIFILSRVKQGNA